MRGGVTCGAGRGRGSRGMALVLLLVHGTTSACTRTGTVNADRYVTCGRGALAALVNRGTMTTTGGAGMIAGDRMKPLLSAGCRRPAATVNCGVTD